MGLLGFFREIDVRDDEVVVRQNTGIHRWPLAFAAACAIAACTALLVYVTASTSQRDEIMWLGLGALGLAAFFLGVRWMAGSVRLDFGARRIDDGSSKTPFDAVVCVALTEGLQVMRSQHHRQKLPTYRVVLGLGEPAADVLQRELSRIDGTRLEEGFVAAESQTDELTVDKLMRECGMESYELTEAGTYPTLRHTCRRLAEACDAAIVDLTGSSFQVVHSHEVGLSLAERLRKRGPVPSSTGGDSDDIEVAETSDGLEISWDYSLWSFVLIACLVGGLATAFFFVADMVLVYQLTFGLLFGGGTIGLVYWLFSHSGRHRVVIGEQRLVYEPPLGGGGRTIDVGRINGLYVRPDLSGGMSSLFFLTDGEPVVIRGELEALKALDRRIRSHLRSA